MNSFKPIFKASAAFQALVAGALATLLASVCCLGPLVLLMVGISGAWIGRLAALGPYQPLFIAAACVALYFAWRRIWQPASCEPGLVCATPAAKLAYKVLFAVVALVLLAALGFPLIAPWFY